MLSTQLQEFAALIWKFEMGLTENNCKHFDLSLCTIRINDLIIISRKPFTSGLFLQDFVAITNTPDSRSYTTDGWHLVKKYWQFFKSTKYDITITYIKYKISSSLEIITISFLRTMEYNYNCLYFQFLK